jgi:hypothetical protein
MIESRWESATTHKGYNKQLTQCRRSRVRTSKRASERADLLNDGGLDNHASDQVRVAVGGRTAILKVALLVALGITRHTHRSTTVGNTPREGIDRGGFVSAGETAVVALAVDGNVFGVLGAELLDGGNDGVPAVGLAHGLGAVVGVCTGTVPVAGDGLGIEADDDVVDLADAEQQEARHPEVVAHLDALAWADLVLPLAGHDLGVGAGDLHTGVQAGAVVVLDDLAAEHAVGAGRAVVRTLGAGEAALGPAQRPLLGREHGVLLLDAEPRNVLLDLLHQLGALCAAVGGNRLALRRVALGENENVVAAAERIAVNATRVEQHLGVVAGRLTGARTIIIPDGQLVGRVASLLAWQRARLGTEIDLLETADPNVHGLDHVALVEGTEVVGQHCVDVVVVVGAMARAKSRR